jgi:hemoglobin
MQCSSPPTLSLPSEEQIKELVDCFYSRVRQDALLGPVFARAIGDHWEEHLTKMSDFWSTVMLASRRYKGNPMQVHIDLPRLNQGHFDRWLTLWRITTSELLDAPNAQVFVKKAEFIAERLLSAIDLYHNSPAANPVSPN